MTLLVGWQEEHPACKKRKKTKGELAYPDSPEMRPLTEFSDAISLVPREATFILNVSNISVFLLHSLGKNIQVIGFLSGLFDAAKIKAVLIVAPVGVIVNWTKEFEQR